FIATAQIEAPGVGREEFEQCREQRRFAGAAAPRHDDDRAAPGECGPELRRRPGIDRATLQQVPHAARGGTLPAGSPPEKGFVVAWFGVHDPLPPGLIDRSWERSCHERPLS